MKKAYFASMWKQSKGKVALSPHTVKEA